ncbi:MAG: GIY-YIG nuclease family protein [Acidobacteria bacterium]|nr:GIY-YIG nuclease family protein [Acidobacteriota bacterium]
MKTPAIQDAILAHLKTTGRPESSRDLASRFLRIDRGDEETCRRLLAPFLATLPGVIHRPGEGWTLAPRRVASVVPTPPGSREAPRRDSPVASLKGPSPAATLRDFVALASDGAGPGGSGAVRTASLLPVVAGEPCQEEHLPPWALDDAGPEDTDAGDARPGRGEFPGLSNADLEVLLETVGDLPVVCHRAGREVEPIRRACAGAGLAFQPAVISAAKLGHLLLGLKANHAALDLAAALCLETRGPDDCRGRVRMVAEAFLRLLPILEKRGIDSLDALLEYQDMPAAPLDLSRYAFTADDLRALPSGPGVYRFLDGKGEVIYIGKAKNLRARVSSYFTPSARATPKGRSLLEQVRRLEFDAAASELEATLLEAALLSEHRARLNRQFDVRERPAPYGPRLNLVVVLGDTGAGGEAVGTCTLHLLKSGRYLGRVRGVPGDHSGEPWRGATARVAAAYFPARARRRVQAPAGDAGCGASGIDVDWQLIGSFLRKHRDEVNFLDVDECASPEEAVVRLRVLVTAATSGAGRVVAR